MRLKLVRALYAQEKQSLLNLARCASVAGALSVAGPVLAGSDSPDVENGTGDDPTKPLGKIELLDRYTEAPGPGVEEGTTKQVETNTPFARIEAPFRLSPQWELNFRAEIPVVWTNGVTPENPTGATVSGFGNVLGQAWIVHDFDQRWAVALGGQLVAGLELTFKYRIFHLLYDLLVKSRSLNGPICKFVSQRIYCFVRHLPPPPCIVAYGLLV